MSNLRKPLFALLLALLPAQAPAAEPDPAQKAAVEALTANAINHTVLWDENGNAVKLAISNHGAFKKDKDAPEPTPMGDEGFRNVLALPKLQAIALEHQRMSDAGYALLTNLAELADVRLHYAWGPGKGGPVTKEFPLFLNALPKPLTVLEIKHNFAVDGGCMEKLKPQPEIDKLELDTSYSAPPAVGFIQAARKLRNLQLHRTSMSDDDLQKVFAAIPNVEILEIRPTGPADASAAPITTRSLRGLKNCQKLRVLNMSINWREIVFQGGLDALAALPDFKFLNCNPGDYKQGNILEHPAILELHKARPDIRINNTLGGNPDEKSPQIDAEYNWDRGVTTHG